MDATDTRHFIIATAGHVDQGKSWLVKALTGTDPDRLAEEESRGITIELGFAHLEISADELPGVTFDIGVVDVPGHRDFVRTMVAGAGSIDLALLVVAADDGWMPQTEEHLQIVNYLGVARAVVVMTKADRIEGEENAGCALVREKMAGSSFERVPIIPTSIVTGQGMAPLKRAIAQILAATPALPDIGKPRLPLDRAFSLPGIGTVVTGTLRGGRLHKGEDIVVQPFGEITRIRTIQTHGREVAVAGPGTRVALNLPNAALTTGATAGLGGVSVERGCVVTLPGLGHAHMSCDVLFERSLRLVDRRSGSGRPLKQGTRVWFHCGSCNVPARIYFSERSELSARERALAQIRLETAVYVFTGDRFVLRDWTEQETFGGGVVLNPCGTRKGKRCAGWQSISFSPRLAAVPPHAAIAAELQQSRAVVKDAVLLQSNFSPAEIAEALPKLSEGGGCVLAGDFVLEPTYWKTLSDWARNLIHDFHKERSEQAGVSLATLRSALSSQLVLPGIFDALLADLLRTGFSRTGATIGRTNHRPAFHLKPGLVLAHSSGEPSG